MSPVPYTWDRDGGDRDNGVPGNERVQDGVAGRVARGTERERESERERDRIREGEEERQSRTKGRSAGPQISPVIVSQSLAESRQTIHRRRAETSSLEGCNPPLNRRQSFFNPDERGGKSWIAWRQPACVLSCAALSPSLHLSLTLTRSHALLLIHPLMMKLPNWPITLIEKKVPTQNRISSYEHPWYSEDTAIPIALIAMYI